MIKLIGLNLLPYRDWERQKKKAAFNQWMAIAAVLGVVLAGSVWFLLSQAISNQEDRNQLLKSGIAELDQKIKDVELLELQKKEFLKRKQKIEELQNERYKAAMILSDLNTMMPEGVYLTRIESKDGKAYILTGRALNDNKVAMLMRSLPTTGLFEAPELIGIKTSDGAQEFNLRVGVVQHTASSADTKK